MGSGQWLRVLCMSLAASGLAAYGQSTISTGSVEGTVTDPSASVISRAPITIFGKATGQVIHTATGSSGTYNSGPLIPGSYKVRAEAPNFQTTELDLSVQVGGTTTG